MLYIFAEKTLTRMSLQSKNIIGIKEAMREKKKFSVWFLII